MTVIQGLKKVTAELQRALGKQGGGAGVGEGDSC